MANSTYKFFTKKQGDFLKINAKDFDLYEKILNEGLEKSSELGVALQNGKRITEIAKEVWHDLFGVQPYQFTVFNREDIKSISTELLETEFEIITESKVRALRTIPEIKKSEKWKGIAEHLKGLRSGAYKTPSYQAITRAITAISNKAGGNKPTASLIETLAQALCTVSKKGISEKVSANADLLMTIERELAVFRQCLEKGEQFINNHKK